MVEEIYRIFLTSSLTILGGVLVYVLGQLISKFYIDPVDKLRETMGELRDILIFYSNVYTNPGTAKNEMMDETSDKLRKMATLILSRFSLIKGYEF